MKLSLLRAHNCMSLRALNIEIPETANVVMLAGPNGAGKTTLIECIRWALTGDLPRDLDYKKDLPSMITEGEKEGWFLVGVRDDDRTSDYKISLKTGNYAGSSPPAATGWSLALAPQRFLALDPAARRQALFDRAGISLAGADIAAKLIEQGCVKEHVVAVGKALGAGFDKALTVAREKYLEARGAWSQITGENYGDVKAATWEAVQPTTWDDPEETAALEKKLESSLIKAKELLDTLKLQDRQGEGAPVLRELSATEPKLLAALESLADRVAEKKAFIESLGEAQQTASYWTHRCPCCEEMLRVGGGKLVKHEPETKPTADDARVRADAKSALAELERKHGDAKAAWEKAKGATVALAQMPERPSRAEMEAATAEVNRLSAELSDTRVTRQRGEEARAAAATAVQRTMDAAKRYTEVLSYQKIGEQLKAMPALYLESALSVINTGMAELSAAYGTPVVLGQDMTLYYGTIPYGLMSKSQQWRAACALGGALARQHGGTVLMDEFDVIQPSARVPILKALSRIEGVQFVIGATLKAPLTLPDGYLFHWLGE